VNAKKFPIPSQMAGKKILHDNNNLWLMLNFVEPGPGKISDDQLYI
jgi:hypothetical protein